MLMKAFVFDDGYTYTLDSNWFINTLFINFNERNTIGSKVPINSIIRKCT